MLRRAMMLALGLSGLLAGCGGGRELPTAPCPRVAILQDGADLTRYVPGAGQDLTVLVTDARITGIQARCDYARRGRELDVTLTVNFEAERGPAAQGRAVGLPWFVAVSDAADTRVIDRREFVTRVNFPPNVDRARETSQPVNLTFPLGEGQRAEDYNVRVSFQLTPEELELNRRRGPR